MKQRQRHLLVTLFRITDGNGCKPVKTSITPNNEIIYAILHYITLYLLYKPGKTVMGASLCPIKKQDFINRGLPQAIRK